MGVAVGAVRLRRNYSREARGEASSSSDELKDRSVLRSGAPGTGVRIVDAGDGEIRGCHVGDASGSRSMLMTRSGRPADSSERDRRRLRLEAELGQAKLTLRPLLPGVSASSSRGLSASSGAVTVFGVPQLDRRRTAGRTNFRPTRSATTVNPHARPTAPQASARQRDETTEAVASSAWAIWSNSMQLSARCVAVITSLEVRPKTTAAVGAA
mmetsp:Transcript_7967/g.23760  ORF Transcript_7967/g.23760 Transcript_7967/m.23760 type:complete len:212 (+) Transcript_7967:79-714(+)